ncbi:MAG: hypothetical protein AVDCRST_MAG64-580, partial [uncultured Phycisphaerae bacterium]
WRTTSPTMPTTPTRRATAGRSRGSPSRAGCCSSSPSWRARPVSLCTSSGSPTTWGRAVTRCSCSPCRSWWPASSSFSPPPGCWNDSGCGSTGGRI